ncbi:hypothetical protein Q1Z72_12480 [Pseudomonas qingdaonensis]|jgi:hypothetical protein|uniref:hypothetical protein n=1 Tax=Pseudomonas qingdaonensis TaxID=2056231 RepID=UPI001E5DD8FE|nr:hypothetical protein [Pseudomonas qingdaonensis]WKL69423.1 hypothetical protein Q1Z72_12480 [Pseudomonas qingdaonensis]
MADIYDRSRALAVRMLAPREKGGKGAAMMLQRRQQGAYDPVAGGATTVTVNHAGSALRDAYAQKDIDGTRIKQGDVKLLVSPQKLDGTDLPVPTTQDQVIFDGRTYTLITVVPWNYAGLDVGFEVQARA